MFKGTAEALKELAAGPPLEFPTEEWTQEQVKDWFRAIGPAIAEVWAAWAGEVPVEIAECVEKTDIEHKGIPVRILKKKNAGDDLPVVVYYHGGGFAGKSFGVLNSLMSVFEQQASHFVLNHSVWSAKDPVYDAYLTRLAALGSCIIVAVDYRLTPDAPFPAGLEDSYMVAKWVSEGGAIASGTSVNFQEAFEYLRFSDSSSHSLITTFASNLLQGVPKGNVVLAGDSAGTNLAFGVALKAKEGW